MAKATVFFSVALMLTGCILDSLKNPEENLSDQAKMITVEATMPGPDAQGSLQTRISLEQDNLDVKLAWEEGDKIDLLIVYEENEEVKTKQIKNVAVTVDQHNTKKATFTIDLDGVNSETFDLYGVYGGGGLDNENPKQLLLPASSAPASGKLEDFRDILVLTFAKTISTNNPSVSVNFEHLGSLFKISLKNNTTATIQNITKAVLESEDNIPAYIHEINATYDITNGDFNGTVTNAKILSFSASAAELEAGDVLEFWGWYIPAEDNWPALKLRIEINEGTDYLTFDQKPARTAKTEKGRTFHFFAAVSEFDSTTDFRFTGPDYLIYGTFTDSRDETEYKTVTIGNQVWMAENLKYLPAVSPKGTPEAPPENQTEWSDWYANLTSNYYVYGYDSFDIEAAKAHTEDGVNMYQTYGVLYNWPAATTACPDGWHLPSHAEWMQLEMSLGMSNSEANTSQSFRGTDEGQKLKEAGFNHWQTHATNGGTNISGFTAFPGGCRTIGKAGISGKSPDYASIKKDGNWWTADERGQYNNNGCYRTLEYDNSKVGRYNDSKAYGYSVRCVKD